MHSAPPMTDMEETLRIYADTVFRAAMAMVKNRQDAEDIAQEVFISLMRTNPVFESAEHQKAWLLRATINRCKSFFRSAWQSRTQGMEEEFPDVSFTPAESTVTQAVNALPEELRTAITLREVEGLSYDEIALKMNCPIGTVRSRIFRAREAIDVELRPLVDSDSATRERNRP